MSPLGRLLLLQLLLLLVELPLKAEELWPSMAAQELEAAGAHFVTMGVGQEAVTEKTERNEEDN